jgi:hypothetical protein
MSECMQKISALTGTHIFDIWAGMDSDHITVLHSQVVSDDSVDSGTAVIKIVIG